MLYKLNRYTGRDYADLSAFIQNANAPSTSSLMEQLDRSSYEPISKEKRELGGVRVSDSIVKRAPLAPLGPVILPESTLEMFVKPTGRALAYLTGSKRKLTQKTIDRWGILWHPKAGRIALPIRDVQGRLVGISGRAISDDIKPKFLHSAGFQRNLYLFGEHLAVPGRRGYIIEGHFDAIYLDQMGYKNTLAIMGGSVSALQTEKIVHLCTDVVIVPDGDEPGKAIAEGAERVLKARLPTRVAAVPDGYDPDELEDDYLHNILGFPE
jgi:hypothetical protein